MQFNDLKKRFPVFSKNPNLVFFDTAASALKVDSMINAITECYSYEYANPLKVPDSVSSIPNSKQALF